MIQFDVMDHDLRTTAPKPGAHHPNGDQDGRSEGQQRDDPSSDHVGRGPQTSRQHAGHAVAPPLAVLV